MPDLHKKIKIGHPFTIKLLIMNNLNQNQHARTMPESCPIPGILEVNTDITADSFKLKKRLPAPASYDI